MCDRNAAGLRKKVMERMFQRAEDGGIAVETLDDPRREVIWRAAATERNPVVRSALPVDDEMAAVV